MEQSRTDKSDSTRSEERGRQQNGNARMIVLSKEKHLLFYQFQRNSVSSEKYRYFKLLNWTDLMINQHC